MYAKLGHTQKHSHFIPFLAALRLGTQLFFGVYDLYVKLCSLKALLCSALKQKLDVFPGFRLHVENFNPCFGFYLPRSLHLKNLSKKRLNSLPSSGN